jgi:hypothetical protein
MEKTNASRHHVHIFRLVILFLLCGPLLIPLAFFVAHFLFTGEASLKALGGPLDAPGRVAAGALGVAVAWWVVSALLPPFWPITLMPTLLAGVVSGSILRCVLSRCAFTRARLAALSAAVCAACSALAYAFTSSITGWLDPEFLLR